MPHVNDSVTGHLERWELPFADNCLSVTAIAMPKSVDHLKVVVMPEGLGKYPGYVLDFNGAHFLKIYDESCAPSDQGWFNILKAAPRSYTYVWHNSPLVRQYAGIGCPPMEDIPKLKHYFLLGRDAIVEILAYQEPMLREFKEPERFNVEYSF